MIAEQVGSVDRRVANERRRAERLKTFFLIGGCVFGIAVCFALTVAMQNIATLKEKNVELESRLQTIASTMPVSFSLANLGRELGIFSPETLRVYSRSVAPLNTRNTLGVRGYGAAGYLGHGYFITVKHGIQPLEEGENHPRHPVIDLLIAGRRVPARVVDRGNAQIEVHPGDWAILKVSEPVDLAALNVSLDYGFQHSDLVARIGNDYDKGIITSLGHVGPRQANGLITSLTETHPGVSGGAVMSLDGRLVGMPIGRMQGGYSYSFILPLRAEMFRKVPHLRVPPA